MSPTEGAVVRYALRIDVSDVVGLPNADVAVSVVAPAEAKGPHTLAVAFPGGGYSRGYWDITWPGGYSQADYHASRGWIFAAVDHLGCGDSSPVDPALLTIEAMARAAADLTQRIARGLTAGCVIESLAPVDITRVIGIGQSMGGLISIVAQAAYQPFDALAVLGCSASHTVLPLPATGVGLIDEALIGPEAAALSWAYHHDDVEIGIRNADLKGGFPFRTEGVPPWGSATIPASALSTISPGVVVDEAARITVPVFIGMGDRDVCANPGSEPACYGAARDVTLAVVAPMAHMHNFASSREQLWDRLHDWATGAGGMPGRNQSIPAATSSSRSAGSMRSASSSMSSAISGVVTKPKSTDPQ